MAIVPCLTVLEGLVHQPEYFKQMIDFLLKVRGMIAYMNELMMNSQYTSTRI